MFLGWGARMALPFVALLAVVAAVTSEPLAFILAMVAFTSVWWLSLWIAFERGERDALTRERHQSP